MKKKYEELYLTKNNTQDALARLVEIIKVLRVECPWDKVQTHESLTRCMVEEAYEVVEAINNEDKENLREELGDVLLQVVFHGQLAEEEGNFNLTDVINEECEKMIRRHPHIFLDEEAKTIDKVLEKWENMKGLEHSSESYTDRLTAVPKALPALIRSAKVQKKAASVGFDWQDVKGALDKLNEEIAEVMEAYSEENREHLQEEMGDLLFSIVNVSRFLKLDAEETLNKATDKFIERFSEMEKLAEDEGADFASLNLDEMDMLWERVKKR